MEIKIKLCYNYIIMKKKILAVAITTLLLAGTCSARQIIDNKNKFYINLPDRYLLEEKPTTDNKFVVMEAYDPNDDSNFTIKISPSEVTEIRGMSLDDERSKFRETLQDMGLEPYVESILHMAPNHECIYTFSRVEDEGEILNYLIAKFWAHNKEYAFFCIQPTKTLRTQEFIDSIDSFICMQHNNVRLPYPEKKERPEYDKAKSQYDNLVKKTNLEAEKLKSEGKNEEAEKLLAELPVFEIKPEEYIPRVEINSAKPLPIDITDPTAHEALYSEHPEQVYAKAAKKQNPFQKFENKVITPAEETKLSAIKQKANKDAIEEKEEQEPSSVPEKKIVKEKPAELTEPEATEEIAPRVYINPPAIKKEPPANNQQRVTIIKDGKAVEGYKKVPPRELTKEELKQIQKAKEEKIKKQKELLKQQQKELEKQRKELERELRKRK